MELASKQLFSIQKIDHHWTIFLVCFLANRKKQIIERKCHRLQPNKKRGPISICFNFPFLYAGEQHGFDQHTDPSEFKWRRQSEWLFFSQALAYSSLTAWDATVNLYLLRCSNTKESQASVKSQTGTRAIRKKQLEKKAHIFSDAFSAGTLDLKDPTLSPFAKVTGK